MKTARDDDSLFSMASGGFESYSQKSMQIDLITEADWEWLAKNGIMSVGAG